MHLAIIGCGNMGAGLAEHLSPTHHIFLHDRDREQAQKLAQRIGAKACESIIHVVEKAHMILLAIKPQNLKEVAHDLEPHLKPDHIVISLLAGTSLATLKHYFLKSIVVRMMPNLAVRYGQGVVGLVDSPELTSMLKKELQELFTPSGLIYWLQEKQVDALTSLTSSGPAFLLTLIEAMTEAGIAMGFQAKDAQTLVIQMIQGSLTLLQETGKHPAELKWQIASPSGTTIAGLRVLERENVRSGLLEAFIAAYKRAQELSES